MKGAAALLVLLFVLQSVLVLPAGASGPSDEPVLSPHPPIEIVGNEGFQDESGVTGGSGTADDPYQIAGWTIVGGHIPPITIRETDAHVKITGNSLIMPTWWTTGSGFTVHLDDASNVSIVENEIATVSWGIFVEGGRNLLVQDNEIHPLSMNPGVVYVLLGAITIISVTDAKVEGNTMEKFARGISIQSHSYNVTISDNLIEEISWTAAIEAVAGSEHIRIYENTIRKQPHAHGIAIYGDVKQVDIEANWVSDANFAIDISRGLGSSPSHVEVGNNTFDSMKRALIECDGCRVNHNLFSRVREGVSFVSSDLSIHNNVFERSDLAIQSVIPGARFHNNSFDPQNVYHAHAHGYEIDLSHSWWGSPEAPDGSKFLITHQNGSVKVHPILLEEPETLGPQATDGS